MEQLRADKKTEEERKVYNNPRLFEESRTENSTRSPSNFSRGNASQAAKRLQSAGVRAKKLTSKNSQPSKGIYSRMARAMAQNQKKDQEKANEDTASTVSRALIAQDLIYNVPLVGPKTTRNEKTRNSAAPQQHFRTNTLVADSSKKEKIHNSLGSISLGVATSGDLKMHTRDSLKAHDKRALIDNFLRNEEVFKLLYETVFSPTSASGGRVTQSGAATSEAWKPNVDARG